MSGPSPHTPVWRLALLAAAVFLVAFHVPYVPFSDPAIRAASGGEGLFDVRPVYGPDEVRAALAAFGEEGRRRYLWFLGADAAFIVCYAVGLSGLLRHLGARRAAFAPVLLAVLDAAENSTVAALLLSATPAPAAMRLAPVFTVGKHAATLLVLALLVATWRARRRRSGPATA